MTKIKATERKFVARVVLLALARRVDRMAEAYEQEGKVQLSQQADLTAHKLYRALDDAEETPDEPELTAEELQDTLTSVLDLTEESKALIEEALGEEETHEEADKEEEAMEDEEPLEEGPSEDFPILEASRPKKGTPKVAQTPIKRGYRIQAIR
jgi:uncharacterized membrane protein YccC